MTRPFAHAQDAAAPTVAVSPPPEVDPLARFAYVESADDEDIDAGHVHGRGCTCHLRGC